MSPQFFQIHEKCSNQTIDARSTLSTVVSVLALIIVSFIHNTRDLQICFVRSEEEANQCVNDHISSVELTVLAYSCTHGRCLDTETVTAFDFDSHMFLHVSL